MSRSIRSDAERAILAAYAAGKDLHAIAAELDVPHGRVSLLVQDVAQFNRPYARTLVVEYEQQSRRPVAPVRPAPSAMFSTPPVAAPAPPAAIEPPAVPEPAVEPEPTPPPAPPAPPKPEIVVTVEPSAPTYEDLLDRAEKSGDAKLEKLAGKAREVLDELDDRLTAFEAAQEALAEIAELEAKLETARQKLIAQRPSQRAVARTGPDAKAVRAWAAENGIEVSPYGVLPRTLINAYVAARPS